MSDLFPPGERFGLRYISAPEFSSGIDMEAIHERFLRNLVGDAYDSMLESNEATSAYLNDSRPAFRQAALSLLVDYWPRSRNLIALCEQIAFTDLSIEVRSDAILHLGGLYSGTSDPRPGRLLADLVKSEQELTKVRKAAYFSLLLIRDTSPDRWPDPDTFRIPGDIEWDFVESFFREPPPGPEDSLPHSSEMPSELRSGLLAYSHGMQAFKRQEYREAVDHFTISLDDIPRSPMGRFMRGCAYGNLGDLDAAIADFTAAIEMKPDYALAYYERAEAYRRKRLPELAEADARRATELDPGLTDNE